MARCYGKLIVMVALAIELMLPHATGIAQEKMEYPKAKKLTRSTNTLAPKFLTNTAGWKTMCANPTKSRNGSKTRIKSR